VLAEGGYHYHHHHHHHHHGKVYRGTFGIHSPIDVMYYDGTNSKPSWGCLGLIEATSKFKDGPRWQIRNGHTISGPRGWCNNNKLQLQVQIQYNPWKNRLVAALFKHSWTGWDIAKIRSLFPHNVIWHNVSHNIRSTEKPDRLYWPLNSDKDFKAKLGYRWLMDRNMTNLDTHETKMWKTLWSLPVPNRWKILTWKVYHNTP